LEGENLHGHGNSFQFAVAPLRLWAKNALSLGENRKKRLGTVAAVNLPQ
jgi:hypothetical protein